MIEQNIKNLIYKQDPHAGMDQLFFTNKDTIISFTVEGTTKGG